ncbi:MAG: hypothetical protein RJB01_1022 [Actinomycetota bacterium]
MLLMPGLPWLAPHLAGRLMPGVVSLGEYAIYWAGLIVIGVVAVVAALVQYIRKK